MAQFRKTVSNFLSATLWFVVIGGVSANFWLSFAYYFDVGEVLVPPDVSREGFTFSVSGGALRPFKGSYKVILRDFHSGAAVREYPKSGVFEYRPENRYPADVEFDWWVGQQGRLDPLPTGTLFMDTCWTVHERAGGLFPSVTGCVKSNAFRVN